VRWSRTKRYSQVDLVDPFRVVGSAVVAAEVLKGMTRPAPAPQAFPVLPAFPGLRSSRKALGCCRGAKWWYLIPGPFERGGRDWDWDWDWDAIAS
jgi:hypothetical protein